MRPSILLFAPYLTCTIHHSNQGLYQKLASAANVIFFPPTDKPFHPPETLNMLRVEPQKMLDE